MEQYISKDALVVEIKRYKHKADERLKIKGRSLAEERKDSALQNLCGNLLYFIDTLEVKEVSMPALDNGNMPVERWKEACEAASCQANYRKSKGLTETCDDYFVDGVQWADEHPKKVKEVDLEKELYKAFGQVKDFTLGMCIARHFYELGLKTKKGE